MYTLNIFTLSNNCFMLTPLPLNNKYVCIIQIHTQKI